MEKAENSLREYLEEVLDGLHCKPRNVTIKPLSSDGANFTSGLFKVTVTSPRQETLHLFCKVAIVGEAMRERWDVGRMFLQERRVYEDLQKSYDSLQTKYGVPERDRYPFAKYYGCNLTLGSEIFILEDLTEKGFRIYDRFDTSDLDHVSENIKVLAKFHALSMALEKEAPEVFQLLSKCTVPVEVMSERVRDLFESFIGDLSEDHKTRVRNFAKNVGCSEFLENHYKPYGKNILVHGDFRPSNIMYKQEGEDITVIPVDFQTVRIGCAVTDILYFMMTATDGELRKKHFEPLMDLYHSQLGLRLAALGLDVDAVYPRRQFDEELKKMLPALLPLSMLMYPVLLVAPDDAPQVSGDNDIRGFEVHTTTKSTARLTDIIEDLIRWKIL